MHFTQAAEVRYNENKIYGSDVVMQVYEQGVLPSSRVYFHTAAQSSKKQFLTLVCTGKYDCDGTYRVARNSYESGLVLLVLSGTGYVHAHGRRQILRAGDFLMLNCYEPHCYGTSEGWSILWAHFAGDSARGLLDLSQEHPCVVHPGIRTLSMRRSLEEIYAMFASDVRAADAQIHLSLTELTIPFLLFQSPGDADGASGRMDRVASVLTANIADPPSSAELADMVHMSVSQLNRSFKREKGLSPHQYLLEARMSAAEFLLSTTELSLPRIAELCGFTDVSAMTHHFRRRIGISPGAYAKKHRTNQNRDDSK